MEFCHNQSSANAGSNEPGHGSGNLKNQRSGLADDDNWKIPKMPRPNEVDFCSKKIGSENFAGFERSNLWESGVEDGQKMLSFSSNTEQARFNGGINGGRNITFSIYQDGNHRGNEGGFNEVMRGPFARLKGPFTPSQWMELEVQALIYKHFVANVPVPSNLLLPIKRSLYSYGSSASYYASNFLGWGPFHLGFSGSNDPEPGRCRRTDGKKWRCSRDAVPDQKYCERHINRGRHRSRKPVEGQNGQAISGSTNTKKVELIAPSTSASLMSGRSASNSLGVVQQQYNSSLQQQQPNTVNAFSDHLGNRTQGFQGLTLTLNPKSKEIPFSVQKKHFPSEESSHSMFGLVTSDSLLNPCMNTTNPESCLGFNEKEPNNQHPVHHFIDDFPKDQPTNTSWTEELKSDWTQLSMSIPMAQDPDQEKSTVPTLSLLSNDLDPVTSLSVSRYFGEPITKQSWLPVTWGSSMGGPLGEVLSSTGLTQVVRSSPTDVLQKSTFVTLSNSSSGSSPVRDENEKVPENGTLCYGFGSVLVSSKAIPSL